MAQQWLWLEIRNEAMVKATPVVLQADGVMTWGRHTTGSWEYFYDVHCDEGKFYITFGASRHGIPKRHILKQCDNTTAELLPHSDPEYDHNYMFPPGSKTHNNENIIVMQKVHVRK